LRCQGLPADFDRRLPFATENLIVIETNIDDMSPQVLAFAMEELLAAGGLDVWAAPVLMKKNRSGTTLGVLCDAGHAKALTELIFRETTTLGVRIQNCKRVSVHRENKLVSTRWGPVQVKVAGLGKYPINVQAEYDDCAELARRQNIPLKDLLREAIHSYYRETSEARR